MQQISEFLVNYWQYISIALVVIIDIILFLFKKKPSIICESLWTRIPMLIEQAELVFGSGHGKEKLDYVVNQLYEEYPQYRSISYDYIEYIVNSLLDLPVRKGGPGREKDV